MKGEILKILRNANGYVSGQVLCDHFGVSRTAVWKAIKQLQSEGYQINAVRNRGYIFVDGADVVLKEEIESLLDTRWAGSNVVCFDETGSTNDQAKKLAYDGAPNGTLVVADRQVSGKGRKGRSWESPSGVGIWMSLVVRPAISAASAPMLTLIMAMAVAKGIKKVTDIECQIKWPNDLVVNKKKVCGILTEMSTEFSDIRYIVIGVGINVSQTGFDGELSDTATSLFIESGKNFKRSEIIAAAMEAFEEYYAKFIETDDLSALKDEYNAILVSKDGEVCVLDPSGSFQGISLGISDNGGLLVRRIDGAITEVISGEVSVRGIYGYV